MKGIKLNLPLDRTSSPMTLLQEFSTLQDFLHQEMGLSMSRLKKSGVSKKFLEKKVLRADELDLSLDLVNHGRISPYYEGTPIAVIAQTKEFLVLNKPSLIHSHPLTYLESDNVLSFLRSENYLPHYFLQKGEMDRGLLYRLDFETSGVLVIVKNPSVHKKMREGFHKFVHKKEYLAIVQGEFHKPLDLSHKLAPSGIKGSKMKEDATGEGAHLHVVPLAVSEGYSLLKIKLKEGMRHQIRVQLSLAGFPIVGDELYGAKKSDRLFLHAYKYSMTWDGKEYQFEAKQAELFEQFFDLNAIL